VKHVIEHGPVFSTLKVTLDQGETVRAEAGAMISMSPSVDLKAKKSAKGIFGSIKAMVGGESFFASEYTATEPSSEVVFAPSSPGDIIHFSLQGQSIFAQSGAYLAGSPGLELSTKGSVRSMISGEGLFLQKITGTGDVWLNSFGAVYEVALAAGQEYVVDTGNMVAYEESVTYTIKKASKGIFSSLASGEGLVCRFAGPGKVWIQTRSIPALASLIQPYLSSR
jgi:uncharacterized protein (TIGR00266 family)